MITRMVNLALMMVLILSGQQVFAAPTTQNAQVEEVTLSSARPIMGLHYNQGQKQQGITYQQLAGADEATLQKMIEKNRSVMERLLSPSRVDQDMARVDSNSIACSLVAVLNLGQQLSRYSSWEDDLKFGRERELLALLRANQSLDTAQLQEKKERLADRYENRAEQVNTNVERYATMLDMELANLQANLDVMEAYDVLRDEVGPLLHGATMKAYHHNEERFKQRWPDLHARISEVLGKVTGQNDDPLLFDGSSTRMATGY